MLLGYLQVLGSDARLYKVLLVAAEREGLIAAQPLVGPPSPDVFRVFRMVRLCAPERAYLIPARIET